jgi:CO/xanthine dehydrogenase FAD-binding subunit
MVSVNLSINSQGTIGDAGIAVGSCSTVALRLTALESALKGRRPAGGLGALVQSAHLSALTPIDDIRASAAYRREAALCLVRRALDDCAARLP